MRKFFVSALALGAILALATSGFALEKSQAQFSDQLGDWNAGSTTCSVQYYNICTGYIWVWSGWADGSIVGNGFDACCGPAGGQLDGSFFYYRTGGVPGYGFTGSAAVYAADGSDNPVGAAIASQAILPAAGWNFSTWGVNVPGRFLILHTVQDDLGLGTPVTIATDGAGGACGVCFPTTRTTNSYTYGTETAMIPPSPFNDGACFVELLTAAQMTCTVSVEDESWGSIKNLYR